MGAKTDMEIWKKRVTPQKLWSHGTSARSQCRFACDRAFAHCSHLRSTLHLCLHFSLMKVRRPDVKEGRTLNSPSVRNNVQTISKCDVALPLALWAQWVYSQLIIYLRESRDVVSPQTDCARKLSGWTVYQTIQTSTCSLLSSSTSHIKLVIKLLD